MNKRLFVLICSVILFQYIYNDNPCVVDGETFTEPTKSLCNQRDGENSQICVAKYDDSNPPTQVGCELKEKGNVPCGEVEAGASDPLCMSLKTTDNTKVCLKDSEACKETAKSDTNCEEVKAGASDALCKSLLKTDDTFLCVKDGNACKEKKKCKNGEGNDDTTCKTFAVETAGNVCKSDPDAKGKCKEVKNESATSSSYSLKFSLALLIFLFLF